ncbi:MAG: protein serine/threonine phosphatase [Bacteroidetes bacterium]|jgi:serine phosphatase RsbU (regulator of sigma subunit)|nr:protein serine/threonine phosphatase [Bacteroidota bacterium]
MLLLRKKYITATFFCLLAIFKYNGLWAQDITRDTLLLNEYNNLCHKYEDESADSLFKYANLQLNLAIKINSVPHQVRAYTNLGVASTRLFKFNDALVNYLKARKILEKNYNSGVSPIYGQIGYIYLRLYRKEEAYKYFKMQQSSSLVEKNYKSYLGSIVNLSDYFNTQGQVDSTISILNNGLSVSRKHGIHHFEVIILDNLANAYYALAQEKGDKKLFVKVQQYADTALALHYQDKDSTAIFYIYGLLGAVNMDIGNYAKAENYYRQYISYSERTSDIFNLKIAMDEFSALYALQGKYQMAYRLRLRYDSINKLYLGEVANQQVEELNTKYGTEKKEQQNLLLQQQNELSAKTIKQQKLISYFIITGLILSLVFAFFMYRVYNQKKKAHQLITLQKEEVERKQIEIEHQKQVIEGKQKEILDSINYAKRIQYALLASDDLLKRNLRSVHDNHTSDYFVYFKPKDIVSGDFYWAAEHDNKFYLAACDSTGHGVPGAFMSLLNIGFLNEAIKEKNIDRPDEIFNYVRARLIKSISGEGQKDGMDGVLISYDKTNQKIEYSAANNSPLLIRDNKIIELEKDRMPVGKGENENGFKLFSIDVKKGDVLYLYTDGYADQFGGPKAKKFKYKQLNELLLKYHNESMSSVEMILDRAFNEWKNQLEQVDDVLLVGIRL